VLLSAAMSLDGYLDDAGPDRLLLSSPEDFAEVDEVRAGVDAILVGANTVRADNPRLLVRSPEHRRRRVERGLPESPAKVALSGGGQLDPAAAFFTHRRHRAAGLRARRGAAGGHRSAGCRGHRGRRR